MRYDPHILIHIDMKRLISIFSLVFLGLMSISCYDDSALWESFNDHEQRIKNLETQVAEINTNLTSLQALVTAMKQGDFITEVKPLTENGVEIGYQITFHEHEAITIYHGKDGVDGADGNDGHAPVIGVKQDVDGIYYWTLNGEWLLDDNGGKLQVAPKDGVPGITPELKIENDKWYVSYDNGSTWEELGSAVSESTGACMFKDVTLTETALVLTMSDGSVITLPVGDRFRIVLGDFDADNIQYGIDVVVPYTVEGAAGEISVFVVSDGWMFETELVEETALSGKLTIRQDDYYDEEVSGKVAIFAVAEDGTTVSKVIRLSSGVLYPSSDNYNDVYTVGSEASRLEFTISTNREVKVNTNADWITYADTKAVEEKTLVFDIKENTGSRRKTYVEISSGDIDFGFTVTQKGDSEGFKIDVTCNEVVGGWWNVNVDTLYNKAGQSIHEVLGYSSWEELAVAAGGDFDMLYNRRGEVILASYDLYSGAVQPYSEEYRNGLGFSHDSEGYVTADWRLAKTVWFWFTDWDGNVERLSKVWAFNTTGQIYAGESYSFGILFKSPEAEANIEVTVNVTEYADPEKGSYDTPAAPGRYDFTVRNVVDLDAGVVDHVQNFEVAELIKSTLGMTTLEFGRAVQNGLVDLEFILVDGTRMDGREAIRLDKNSLLTEWNNETMVGSLNWSFGLVPEGLHIYMYLPTVWTGTGAVFTYGVQSAAGSTVKYDYVIRYEDYELYFTHELEYAGEQMAGGYGHALKLVNQTGNGVDVWTAQVWYELGYTFNEGEMYTLSMDVKGTYDYAIQTWLRSGTDGNQVYHMPGIVDVTGEWTRVVLSFIPDVAGMDGFIMNFGDYPTDGAIYIDNISLVSEYDPGNNHIRNAAFEEGHLDGWYNWSGENYMLSEFGEADGTLVPTPDLDWYLVGTFNDWNPGDEAYRMTKEGNRYVFYDFVTTGDELKFNAGDWTVNRGGEFIGTDQATYVWQDGPNMQIPAGVYDVYMNKNADEVHFVFKGAYTDDFNWTKKVTSELWDGFDATKNVKLARYREHILVANGNKIGVVEPYDGTVETVYELPFDVHSFCTDDAGNVLVANDALSGEDLCIYKISDIYGTTEFLNCTPELLLTYNTGNYYAAETGNVRVRGDVNGNAVITAVASEGAGGAVIMWEVVDGVCGEWNWTSVPYTAWSVDNICCTPAGSRLDDGLFYIGYGGDYNLKYAEDPVRNGTSSWATSYVTGSTWMENYNSMSVLSTSNGCRYVAVLMGCHFDYDSADVLVLNADDTAGVYLYTTHNGDNDVSRDDNWTNLDWTGAGTNSDVLLLEVGGQLVGVYVDANYGVMASFRCDQQ